MRLARFGLSLVLMLAGWGSAFGCSCGRSMSCGTAQPNRGMLTWDTTLFLGKVLRVRPATEQMPMGEGRSMSVRKRIYTIAVVDGLRGAQEAGEEVEIETGVGGGDCGYTFALGEEYLVDAQEVEGRLVTGICSGTVEAKWAGLTLRALREPGGTRTPDLSGIVLRSSLNESKIAGPAGVAGVGVTVTGLDGAKVHAVTDEDGVYEVATLPGGVYGVAFEPPADLMPEEPWSKGQGVTIPAAFGSSGAGCEVSLTLYPAGRIPGRVVNATGLGVAGSMVAYDLSPVQERTFARTDGEVGADGRFLLGPLPAGMYWLDFVPKGENAPTWYYPGTRDGRKAESVVVEDGKASAEVQVLLP